ncbi:MAG: glycosyltransferase family 9 protein [Parachlamydiales bacterium]|nr:glycosyltransferase family 9 protein [Parachlamydiales bacterium]
MTQKRFFILFSNIAHVGDVALSLSLIPWARKKFPQATIGFLTSSYGEEMVKNHPMIEKIHVLDHWWLNRKKISLWRKLREYWRSRKNVLKEIREEQYDLSVNLYSFFPLMHFFLWRTRIPQRIGYSRGGIRYGLTGFLPWCNNSYTLLERHLSGLARYWGQKKDLVTNDVYLVQRKNPSHASIHDRYVVCHPGSGKKSSQWEEKKWLALFEKCIEHKIRVVITAKNLEEISFAEHCSTRSEYLVLKTGLVWEDYMALIQGASLLVGVESSAVLLASLMGIPSLGIYSQRGITLWRPCRNCTVMTSFCPKIPCSKYCRKMSCVKNVDVEEVFQWICQNENSLDS